MDTNRNTPNKNTEQTWSDTSPSLTVSSNPLTTNLKNLASKIETTLSIS